MQEFLSLLDGPEHAELFRFLSDIPGEVFLVGGSLREFFLGRSLEDIDLAVSSGAEAAAREVADRAGGSFFPLDRERGMYRAVFPEGPHVDFALFQGRDIREDLGHRDFTVNAMALDLKKKVLVDPFGGISDLSSRLLRATSREVLVEDPLRLLRAVRLAVLLDFEIDPQTLSFMEESSGLLSRVAPERVRDELFKILEADESWESLLLMDELGLLKSILPEMEELKNVRQNACHRFPVWEHSVATVQELERLLAGLSEITPDSGAVREYLLRPCAGERKRLPLLKLAGLLHDVGKPVTRKEEGGKITFIGHDRIGAEMVEIIGKALRLSQHEISVLSRVVRHHLRPIFLGKEEEPSDRSLFRLFRDTEGAVVETLLVSWADVEAGQGPALTEEMIRKHHHFILECLAEYFKGSRRVSPPRLLSGEEIMEALSIPSGPGVGKLLSALEEAIVENKVTTREEALGFLRSQYRPPKKSQKG